MIIVIVDRLTKYIYIIPIIKTINVKQIVSIVLRYIIINYRLLNKIILNYNKLFILKM